VCYKQRSRQLHPRFCPHYALRSALAQLHNGEVDAYADKSEAVSIGSGTRQRSEGSLEVIDLGSVRIQPSESVRSHGVVIDNTLSFDAHVNSVSKAVNYHAKALRNIRKMVTTDVALTIAST